MTAPKQNVRGRVQERTRTKKRNTYRQVAVGWGIRNQKFKGAAFDESAVGSTDSCHFLNSYYCAPRKGAQECNVRCEFKLLQFKRRFDKSLSPLVTSRAAGDSLERFDLKPAIENGNPLSRALLHPVIVRMARCESLLLLLAQAQPDGHHYIGGCSCHRSVSGGLLWARA